MDFEEEFLEDVIDCLGGADILHRISNMGGSFLELGRGYIFLVFSLATVFFWMGHWCYDTEEYSGAHVHAYGVSEL